MSNERAHSGYGVFVRGSVLVGGGTECQLCPRYKITTIISKIHLVNVTSIILRFMFNNLLSKGTRYSQVLSKYRMVLNVMYISLRVICRWLDRLTPSPAKYLSQIAPI